MAREVEKDARRAAMTIAEGLADVRARIERAAMASGRDANGVKLVAVSKTKPSEAIREAYALGQRAFGENYAQELERKASELADLNDIEWHFIGHAQTNKAKVLARIAHVVHTVDNVSIARELGKRSASAGRVLPVLIEVNVAGEAQKHGAAPSEIAEVIASIQKEPSLVLRGLMTVPPADDLALARTTFETLRSLRLLHGGDRVLPDLSIGMSGDLEIAIDCGATMVRVGSAIFGTR